MKWICLNCGRKNDQTDERCTKCNYDQETALTMQVEKRKKMCEECGHKHQENVYCHVYTEAGGDVEEGDQDLEVESDEEDEEDSDDSDDDDDSNEEIQKLKKLQKSFKPKKEKTNKPKILATPAYIKRMGFIRCNCNVGVPNDSLKFEPLPRIIMIGKIQVQTYNEINEERDRAYYEEQLRSRVTSETAVSKKVEEDAMNIANLLPMILRNLRYVDCAMAPIVNSYWNYGTNLYKEYVDIRNFIPWQVYKVHHGPVDSVLIKDNKVYSGGDRRILVSDYATGQIISTVTRDSGEITKLFEKDYELFSCSTNGSIRTFGLTHTGQNLKMMNTMWDHTRAITDLLTSLPTVGICPMHGIENHVCCMYTTSDDRTIRMWNLAKMQSIRTISSKALKSATYTRLAQSDRHLFCGASTAVIAIFNKEPICEREDIHLCTIPDTDQSYCLQVTLRLPQKRLPSGNLPSVTGLICPQIGPEFPTLWAGDAAGQMTIWYIPRTGLEFSPAYTVKAHQGAINHMSKTWRHVITIGDDGYVILHDVLSFAKVRSVQVMEWGNFRNLFPNPTVYRKLKTMHLEENYDTGGQLVIGTSYGEVVLLSLGTTV